MGDLKLICFERELTELCRKSGLGLTGATVFVMEAEDWALEYSINDQSQLTFGPELKGSSELDLNSGLEASQVPYRHPDSREHL